MTEFFKDQDIFNFAANVIANSTIDAEKNELTLKSFKPLFSMLTSIKKSPVKRMKITEGVKNLMFTYSKNLKEIQEFEVIICLGKALIETNLDELSEVLEEDTKLHPKWMEVYENRKEIDAEIGPYKGNFSLNCES